MEDIAGSAVAGLIAAVAATIILRNWFIKNTCNVLMSSKYRKC